MSREIRPVRRSFCRHGSCSFAEVARVVHSGADLERLGVAARGDQCHNHNHMHSLTHNSFANDNDDDYNTTTTTATTTTNNNNKHNNDKTNNNNHKHIIIIIIIVVMRSVTIHTVRN